MPEPATFLTIRTPLLDYFTRQNTNREIQCQKVFFTILPGVLFCHQVSAVGFRSAYRQLLAGPDLRPMLGHTDDLGESIALGESSQATPLVDIARRRALSKAKGVGTVNSLLAAVQLR